MIQKILVSAAFCFGAVVFAVSAHAQDAGASPRVRSACVGMGLNPSEAPYYECVRSLNRTEASMEEAARTRREGTACGRHGFRPGSAAYATCVLDQENAAAARPQVVQVAQASGSGWFFDSYQRGDQDTSVRRACARLGTVPGTQAFATCVGNLNMTIDDDDMDAVADH